MGFAIADVVGDQLRRLSDVAHNALLADAYQPAIGISPNPISRAA